MRIPARAMALAIGGLLLVTGGCGASRSNRRLALPEELPAARTDVSAARLSERLEAAGSVATMSLRDAAHAAVAYDAAGSGQFDLCETALQRITYTGRRDEAAANCALLAKQQGSLRAARRLADMVASVPLRDAVMAALAKSS